jgi:hypothetical protein
MTTTHLDPTDPETWQQVRATMDRSLSSSLHCAVASIGPDGQPHVSPIGSVMLTGPGQGVYLHAYSVELDRNLDRDPRLTVMAVDSGRRTWYRALIRGRFDAPPGLRLIGTAGPARPPNDEERARFRRRVGPARRTRGGNRLWGHDEHFRARDLTFTQVVPIRLASMTADLWPRDTEPSPSKS